MGVKIQHKLLYHSVATQRHPLFECDVLEGHIIFIFVCRRRCNINFYLRWNQYKTRGHMYQNFSHTM